MSAGWYTPPPARVTKLQCLVTSYRRPAALEACLASMRQWDIQLYAVDGGDRDEDTTAILNRYCDRWLGLEGNPGADVLRNVGLQQFITDPVCVISSEDYIYPACWADTLLEQWYALQDAARAGASKWGMIACPEDGYMDGRDESDFYAGNNLFSQRRMLPTYGLLGASGLMVDTDLLRRIGGFPVYGRFGRGLTALSLEMKKRHLLCGYTSDPVVTVMRGDFAKEYADRRLADHDRWDARAFDHKPGERSGFLWPSDLPGDAL